MAIQNFLSGGYYGKLGATVGQRWKNKRTIRTYVVPKNPRTPIQQANRGKFANAVTYAQMGLQMNYYATCFDDPNFTHWNYRMKAARELKNAGLTNLDLIPLYPTTFNPPSLITEITKDTVQGQKHITFATPSLNGNTDRVFSLMFSLYDNNNQPLGLKLYLGYYYATNPGFLEVDVDDINEINKNCFVRIVSNDDIDSTTDMIASPTLQVKTVEVDVRNFNTTIHEVQKSSTGIKVIFEESWKGTPTVNTIDITAHFVSDGAEVTDARTNLSLQNENGYCSVTLPLIDAVNQLLPAFPSGSYFEIPSVRYQARLWEYTKTNAIENYSDSDLTRNIVATPSFNPNNLGVMYFTMPFNGEFAGFTRQFQVLCSGRLDDRSVQQMNFNITQWGINIRFENVDPIFAAYPMKDGDYILLPALQIVSHGVTYNIASQTVNFRNGVVNSDYLKHGGKSVYYQREGGGTVGEPLENLYITVENVVMNADPAYNTTWINWIRTVNNHNLVPDYCEMYRDTSVPGSTDLVISANFTDTEYNDEVNENCDITANVTGQSFVYKGITYTFPEVPFSVGDFEE